MEIKKLNSIYDNEFSVELKLENDDIHILGPFTSEEDGINAIKEFELREFGIQEKDLSKLSPFDFVNKFYAGINPFDNMNQGEYDYNHKAYSQFMINRALTMTEDNCAAISLLAKHKIDNYSHAAYCANTMKKPKQYQKWIKENKKSKKEQARIDQIKDEYECSDLRAEEYIEIIDAINNK